MEMPSPELSAAAVVVIAQVFDEEFLLLLVRYVESVRLALTYSVTTVWKCMKLKKNRKEGGKKKINFIQEIDTLLRRRRR